MYVLFICGFVFEQCSDSGSVCVAFYLCLTVKGYCGFSVILEGYLICRSYSIVRVSRAVKVHCCCCVWSYGEVDNIF